MLLYLIPVLCLLLHECEAEYSWRLVNDGDEYSDNTVYHHASDQGTQLVCKYDDLAGRGQIQGQYEGLCEIPSYGLGRYYSKPFHILERDPLVEDMQWTYTTSHQQIRDNGVVSNDSPQGLHEYVCASSEWGSGRLVINENNEATCYVAFGGLAYYATSGYQVLLRNPPSEYRLTDVEYDLDLLDILNEQPKTLAQSTLINRDVRPQLIVTGLTYSKTSESGWEVGYELALSIAYSVSAGIPNLFGTEWSVSAEQAWSLLYGETTSETVTVSLEARVTVPAQSSCVVSIIASELIIDVPYVATLTAYHSDGTTGTSVVTGIYEGLSVANDVVEISECLPVSLAVLNEDEIVDLTEQSELVAVIRN